MRNQNSVRGKKINCINFEMCPLCYGCRNYNFKDPECKFCLNDKKNNICNKEKHKENLISKFITKTTIKINEKLEFKKE